MTTNAFAIYHTWPEMRNAEYEVLQRILRTAKNIGKKAVVINNNGEVIWADADFDIRKGSIISRKDVDFALSLHFESPRTSDIYTYYALWQPLEFYADFGYKYSIDNFSTHHDLMSCHSDLADFHAVNIFNGLGRDIAQPLPSLFHAVPGPFLEPRISNESSLFYVGINWERIGRPKGRFHDLLTKLDDQKLVKIYGPELVQGVAPWAGFSTYSGELPFDGFSVLDAINECGICLALSSKAHQNSGIMSNRLFEGLAGGAAVIANPNALIDKYFSDVVYVVDDSRGSAYLEQKILSCIREIRSNPEAARARVLKGQEIIRQICSLESSLQNLFDQTPARKESFYSKFPRDSRISVLLLVSDGDLPDIERKIEEISEQLFCSIDLHLVVPSRLLGECQITPAGAVVSCVVHGFDFDAVSTEFDGPEKPPIAIGGMIANILGAVNTPYFAIMRISDMLMHDHFASLAHAIEQDPEAACAVSGSLTRSYDASGREQRKLRELRVNEPEKLLVADGELHSGRLLFRASTFKAGHSALLHLLDGCEHHVFLVEALLAGPLAQTSMATHLHDEGAPISVRNLPVSNDLQRQFIRDYYTANGRWIAKTELAPANLALTASSDSAAPLRWRTLHSHRDATKYLEVNRTMPVHTGAPGLDYIVSGFSHPEASGIWLVGDRGVIEFTLPRRAANNLEDYRVVLGLCGQRNSETGRMQHCTFIMNNIAVAYQAIPDFKTQIGIKIPLHIMKDAANFRLEIVPDHAGVVRNEAGHVIDGRTLSVLVDSIAIVRDSYDSVPVFAANTAYPTVNGAAAGRALISGFYPPEREMTWICGVNGDIRFRVSGTLESPVLRLRLAGRAANQVGAPQTAAISVNGSELATVDLSNDAQNYDFDLTAADIANVVEVSIRAAHAEPVIGPDGDIADPRLLGIGIFEIGAFDRNALGVSRNAGKSLTARLLGMVKGN